MINGSPQNRRLPILFYTYAVASSSPRSALSYMVFILIHTLQLRQRFDQAVRQVKGHPGGEARGGL